MKAIVHTSYGPPEVLRLEEVAKPAPPGSGEVLLRVHASAVDQGVWHVTAGLPYLIRATPYGLCGSKPRVRGMDATTHLRARIASHRTRTRFLPATFRMRLRCRAADIKLLPSR